MKKNDRIAEYSLVQRKIVKDENNNIRENSYYIIGKTLVKEDDFGYTDLITKKPILKFNFQEFSDGQIGIMFKKDQNYYQNYINNTVCLYNKNIKNIIGEIKELLASENHLTARNIKNYLHYVAKNICEDKIKRINPYKEEAFLSPQLKKLLKAIERENSYYYNIYLNFYINVKILNDLNSPTFKRINPQKSIYLYASANNMISNTEAKWQQLNAYPSEDNKEQASVNLKRVKKGIFQKLIAKL